MPKISPIYFNECKVNSYVVVFLPLLFFFSVFLIYWYVVTLVIALYEKVPV